MTSSTYWNIFTIARIIRRRRMKTFPDDCDQSAYTVRVQTTRTWFKNGLRTQYEYFDIYFHYLEYTYVRIKIFLRWKKMKNIQKCLLRSRGEYLTRFVQIELLGAIIMRKNAMQFKVWYISVIRDTFKIKNHRISNTLH